jgi:3-hydroxy-9,10-secoandrosta-1,3,5(10)-triene-9,17-dione monooxygenase reductase component
VSLDPPWVLWSLSRASGSFDAFRDAGHWAVHILAHDQEELASRFGRRRHDKFDALPVERGVAGIPLLAGCVTRMQCRSRHQYDGGDHVIMVGEVLGYDHCERVPLVYQRGAFAIASRKEPG